MTDRFVLPLVAPSAAPTTAPARKPLSRRARRRIVSGVIAAVLLFAVLLSGLARNNAAANTLRQLWQDYGNAIDPAESADVRAAGAQAAWQLYCPDVQATVSESQLQAVYDASANGARDIDMSGLQVTVVDWSLTEAHVRLAGSYTFVGSDGQSHTYTFNSTAGANVYTLDASGLGWCLSADALPPGLR
jgi:hypothetical protein